MSGEVNNKVSVIIPVYNRCQYLKKAIDSVLAQIYKDFELIIVDDGSKDGTADLIKKYKDRLIYLYQENKGVSSARNKGISISNGRYIAFLDSDDEWKPEKLEKQIDFFKQNPEYKICQSDEEWIRRGVRVNQKKIHQKQEGWIFEKCLDLCLISPSSVIIHKSIFEHIGVFDETLPACEDYDLWLRISLYYKIGLIKENLVIKYGGHEDQLSRSIWGLDRFRIKALKKILLDKALNETQKDKVCRVLDKKIEIYSNGCLKRGKDFVPQK